jgi:hypothetical protein
LPSVALFVPGLQFLKHVDADAGQVRKKQKACILLQMSGGPTTIKMWDLKPDSTHGGAFKPISTPGDVQIVEHLPQTFRMLKHRPV